MWRAEACQILVYDQPLSIAQQAVILNSLEVNFKRASDI